MKYLILILTLFSACPAPAMDLKATVNDTPISDLDVKNWANLLKFQQAQKYEVASEETLNEDALNAAIEATVKMQTAKAANIKIAEADVNDAKTHLEQQNNLPEGGLAEMLEKSGADIATLTAQLEADLIWLKYLRMKAGNNIFVSDAVVKNRHNAMKEELKKQGITSDSIPLWEIAQGLFPENVNVKTTLESKTCEAFLEHIKIGPYPESAQMGWTDPMQMPPELSAILSELAVGETVGPLRTPEGLLVLMKCNIRQQKVLPSEEEVKQQLEIAQMDVLSRRLLAEATRRAVIEKK